MSINKVSQLGLVFMILCFLITACGPGESPEPTIDPLLETSIFETEVSKAVTEAAPPPTSTFTPTPAPTETPTITPTPTPETIESWDASPYGGGISNPAGIPDEYWEGIPIMPDAITGSESYGGYYYDAEKTLAEVREYYQAELGQAGYRLSAVGEAENTMKLVFTNGEDQIVVNAARIDRESDQIVLKYKGKKEVFGIPEFHGVWILIEH